MIVFNIIMLALAVFSVIFIVWAGKKEMQYVRTLKGRLLQLELDNEHIKADLHMLHNILRQLERVLDNVDEQPKTSKMIIVGTTVGLPKEKNKKTATVKKEDKQSATKKTTASFAAAHREQYSTLRKQGLSVREAGEKAGISYTTACRYEQWIKRNPNVSLKK